jgi:hypothetical protein
MTKVRELDVFKGRTHSLEEGLISSCLGENATLVITKHVIISTILRGLFGDRDGLLGW